MLQVAVIGGGPVGSRVAFKLAEFGYETAVFEKRSQIGQKPCCTGIISHECIVNFNIPPSVIIKSVNSARAFSPSGECVRVYKSDPQAHILNRSGFDCELADRAQHKGVKYYLNTKIVDIKTLNDRVVLYADSDSDISIIEARYVVVAAGFSPALVKRCGLGKASYFVAGAQASVETSEKLNEVEVYFNQSLAPGYFAWLVPLTGNQCLAGLLTRQSPGKHLRSWLDLLKSSGRLKDNQLSVRYGGIPLKPLSKTYADRLLVVGDSAGQVKPTTGGGIYFGLLCADLAAKTIHDSITAGTASAQFLSQYEKLWRDKVGNELKKEYLARRFYEKLTNKQIDGIFKRVNKSGLINMMLESKNLSFDWHGDLLLSGLKLSFTTGLSRLFKIPFNNLG